MPIPKVSKDSVDYSLGYKDSHCCKSFDDDKGYCRYFISPLSSATQLGQCDKVSGSINKVYWAYRDLSQLRLRAAIEAFRAKAHAVGVAQNHLRSCRVSADPTNCLLRKKLS